MIGDDVIRARPAVTINYFTAGHVGSTKFWSTSEGRWCLNSIARHLEKVGGVGFWSANEVSRSVLGALVPRHDGSTQVGGNEFADRSYVVLAYLLEQAPGGRSCPEGRVTRSTMLTSSERVKPKT